VRVSHEIVVLLNIDLYFLRLDAKKVTKKNQGQPETLRAFVVLTPHILLPQNEFAILK